MRVNRKKTFTIYEIKIGPLDPPLYFMWQID